MHGCAIQVTKTITMSIPTTVGGGQQRPHLLSSIVNAGAVFHVAIVGEFDHIRPGVTPDY